MRNVEQIADIIFIYFFAIFTTATAEGLTWFAVYRTPQFKRLTDEVDRRTKKVHKKKPNGTDPIAIDPKARKRLEKDEERLKAVNKELTIFRMKSNFAIGFVFMALLGVLNSIFEGRIVAYLPFTPFALIRGLSHRGLPGTNYQECSFIFIYILATMALRPNLQKLLGVQPSRQVASTSSLFTPPTQQSNGIGYSK
ncbi:hypothetical protein SNEBB_000951 [Seison nebaliae]|nr:hypothetical protein SNEBB_000951 [Seison nebaliae]